MTVLVTGATANVGFFAVRALLERHITVVAPSRSDAKLGELRQRLSRDLSPADLDRLHTVTGDLGDESQAEVLRRRITETVGPPDAVLASLGNFVTTPSLLDATRDDLQRALDGYLVSQLMLARTFLPAVRDAGGTYVLVEGPLAFESHPELGTDLISIATAGQHMLFRALARRLDATKARVVELVIHTLIRDRQTQPGSPLGGGAVGAFAADLVSGAGENVHGQSVHLR